MKMTVEGTKGALEVLAAPVVGGVWVGVRGSRAGAVLLNPHQLGQLLTALVAAQPAPESAPVVSA